MKISLAQASSLLAAFLLPALVSGAQQCQGLDPQPGVSTFLGATLDYSVADRICCHNHKYAENRGYLAAPEVDLFGRLDNETETIWYDSVCGIPLFISPRGRTFEDFKEESLHHGWPSFRPEEIISENVIIHDDGRMESRCLTHLGHNLPKGGVDRYCIDLVCIAGAPLSTNDERVKVLMDQSVITADELDTNAYISSAETFSGKYNDWGRKVMISLVAVASVVVAAMAFFFGRRAWKNRKEQQQQAVEEKCGEARMREEEENSSGTHSSDGV